MISSESRAVGGRRRRSRDIREEVEVEVEVGWNRAREGMKMVEWAGIGGESGVICISRGVCYQIDGMDRKVLVGKWGSEDGIIFPPDDDQSSHIHHR